ncbi:Hypothetical protein GbCGDNIH2_5052 [Granulibacter bethesdensis]|uniref:Uncharacterized protein n=2 Tax=Granulibacter bethesdensis TaxID=364410 RepID=A0A286M371_GRABC|nr:Hypothetical protein GbCGDNIH3_5052 [Granulibacter bethesdensis]AHJ68276.1 Hypothetical protein GbCGDNIH2_5052 [Granulibacter bethesdensis]APH65329.1 Hypothetical protein GbCGDNIH1I4_5052 [Granulibacter bethesdensis]ASV62470.1 Hypothetical protein GbCGDNIH1_5052 [Granulibacter bethesdensis CGDNIH1]
MMAGKTSPVLIVIPAFNPMVIDRCDKKSRRPSRPAESLFYVRSTEAQKQPVCQQNRLQPSLGRQSGLIDE